jgi:hypothetical protein
MNRNSLAGTLRAWAMILHIYADGGVSMPPDEQRALIRQIEEQADKLAPRVDLSTVLQKGEGNPDEQPL